MAFLLGGLPSAGRDARLYGRQDACRHGMSACFLLRLVQVITRRQFVVAFEMIGAERFGNGVFLVEPLAEVHELAAF